MKNDRPAPTRGRPFSDRAEAARRLPPCDCGCRDPWICHCHNTSAPSDRMIDGYLQAAQHLESLGLTPAPLMPELRLMWQRGGTDRRLAQSIAQKWELAA